MLREMALSSLDGPFFGSFVMCPRQHRGPPFLVSVVPKFLGNVAVEVVFVVEVAVHISVAIVEVLVDEQGLFQVLVHDFLKSGGLLVVFVFGGFMCGGEGFPEMV